MAGYTPTPPYLRAPQPSLAGSDRKWIENELKKIEAAIRAMQAALQELKDRVPF